MEVKYGIEKTLAIIKPDGMKHRDVILKRITRAGFHVLQTQIVKLTTEQASEFYKDQYGQPNYPLMVMYLTEGPIQVLCLGKYNAIQNWKILMGPENYHDAKIKWPGCLRSLYASSKDKFQNAVHGSANMEAARHEIHMFFPKMLIEPTDKNVPPQRVTAPEIKMIIFEGLRNVVETRPNDPIKFLAKWLKENNKRKPTAPTQNCNELKESIEHSSILSFVDFMTPQWHFNCKNKVSINTILCDECNQKLCCCTQIKVAAVEAAPPSGEESQYFLDLN